MLCNFPRENHCNLRCPLVGENMGRMWENAALATVAICGPETLTEWELIVLPFLHPRGRRLRIWQGVGKRVSARTGISQGWDASQE